MKKHPTEQSNPFKEGGWALQQKWVLTHKLGSIMFFDSRFEAENFLVKLLKDKTNE
jgi:hypothetical protein